MPLGEIINAVLDAGLQLRLVAEHPEPFLQPDDVDAAVWRGRLPNNVRSPAAPSPSLTPTALSELSGHWRRSLSRPTRWRSEAFCAPATRASRITSSATPVLCTASG